MSAPADRRRPMQLPPEIIASLPAWAREVYEDLQRDGWEEPPPLEEVDPEIAEMLKKMRTRHSLAPDRA